MRDYPRVPITGDINLFKCLARIGRRLIELHLFKSLNSNDGTGAADISSDKWAVEAGYPQYGGGSIWVNPQTKIASTSEAAWHFEIGSYQVCHKWLRDRRGLRLSSGDIEAYRHLIKVVVSTMKRMQEIDEAISAAGGWPLPGSWKPC